MPLEIMQLIMLAVPGMMNLFISVVVPVASKLLTFTLPKLVKIPQYIRLLWAIYQDKDANAEARKYLTSVLLVLGSILTFIVYSYIPLTGLPIIGVFTTPIAGVMALIISLVSLDSIFTLNKDYLSKKYPNEFQDINQDISDLAKTMGSSWEEMVEQTQALLNSVQESIDPNKNYDDTISALVNSLIKYLYDPQSDQNLSPDEINYRIVTDGLPPLAKISGSVAEGITGGAIAGIAAQGAAANIFVQAGFWTSVKAAVGLASGIAVGAPVYTALVVAAPVGLAVATGAGIFYGAATLRNEGEKRKLSAFLSDVLIAALPMAWVDGSFSAEEQDIFKKLLLNPAIRSDDEKRVREAMEKHHSLDEVLSAGLLKEEDSRKAQMKFRLLLCTSWELAKADGVISNEEINLHDRMAKFMNVSQEEVAEIRRLVFLKSGIDLEARIDVIHGDLTQQNSDIIVNSTNINLKPGMKIGWITKYDQRIDVAIHRAAGTDLKRECQSLQSCQIGESKITKGYGLASKWVVHTVTPILKNGDQQEFDLLAQCYRNSLLLAHHHSAKTIAFPALGTGVGKFSLEKSAEIAIQEIQTFLNNNFNIEKVTLVCIDNDVYQVFQEVFQEFLSSTKKLLESATNP